ncbi:MAG: hypothetical protein ACFFCP_09370 [Promethearchaeota archaeon]
MNSGERFVTICGEVGNYTERITGVSIVDAYFGPDEFHPKKQSNDRPVSEIVHGIHETFDSIRDEVSDPLRFEYMMGELHSLNVVVDWLDGKDITYSELVEGLFHISMRKYPEKEIDKSIDAAEVVLTEFPGDDLRDKIERYRRDGEITGEALQNLLEDVLQKQSHEIGQNFRTRIFDIMGASVPDRGVKYEAVKDKPWGAYNWYLGEFTSLNQFNVDRRFNKDSLQATLYHEYEHHVSNLWREKAFLKTGNLELSIVPLHTARCVISEGTADTSKDFLGVSENSPRIMALEALNLLGRMTQLNAAIMLNDEGKSEEEAIDYLIDRGYRTKELAESSLGFISPKTRDGRINLFAPYIFTYFIGRSKFVHPTFLKASEKGLLAEFFRIVYMNPYSGSSVTWNKAFEQL